VDHPDSNVDLDTVADWMSEQGLGEGPLGEVSAVTGGTQNVMLRFTRGARPYVLRRGPRHLRTRSNSVILRETKVLAALAGSDVPHPHLIATCEDPNVLGDAVFYLMEPIDGFNAGEGLPPLHAGDPGIQFQMGLSMAEALAKLGAVDHVAVGLADFGKPDGFLERQVPRWLSELAGDSGHRAGVRLAGEPSAGKLDARHHARRLPRGQRDVLAHRPGRGRDCRLGDVHDR
jgi:aminoglycoside phosphotransferase (APT) family kinase protein